MNILALTASSELTGPCRSLFQLVEHTKGLGVEFVLGIFLLSRHRTSLAIEEAKRRGYSVEILSQSRRYDPALLSRVWKIIRERNISILQSHGYKSAVIAWVLRQLTGLPWIAFAEGYTSENRRMAVYNRLDRWLMRRADVVIAVSQATGTLLERYGVPAKRLAVIPNTIDPGDYDLRADGTSMRAEWGIQPEEFVIGVVGRLSPEKGQTIFLDAVRKVIRRVPRARAVLIGEGQDEPLLRNLAASWGLKDRVIFAGYHPNVSEIYAALDLVVIPSLSEGLPLVLLEGLLHGKGVVATSVGGIPDILQGPLVQWLVPPGDSDALSETMVNAVYDPQKWTELRAIGVSRFREVCSSAGRAHKVFELYQQMVQGTGSGTITSPPIPVKNSSQDAPRWRGASTGSS